MALPTSLDNINATMYAMDRLRRDSCRGVPGTGYKYDDDKRTYPCPRGMEDCFHGRCSITSESACMSRSSGFPPDVDGKRPYLEFRDGKCVYGNVILRKWCELPTERRLESVAGVTDVHPFDYDASSGKCKISREYCERDMQASFMMDENGRPTCYSSTGQLIGEFFVGKTIFRGIERGATLLYENFAGPGLHLYANKDNRLVMDGDEVRRVYPRESYSMREVAMDKNLKRVYAISIVGN